jgi:uncharacterized membrane protein required for colicin V production
MKWLDGVLIIIVIINCLQGYYKGLIRTLFNLAGYVIAFIITKNTYLDLSLWIRSNVFLMEKIQNYISKYIKVKIPETAMGELNLQMFQEYELSSKFTKTLGEYLLKEINFQIYIQQAAKAFEDQMIESITTLFVNTISIILIFTAVRIVVMIMSSIFSQVFKLPVLSIFNGLGGLLLGFLTGILSIVLFILALIPVSILFSEGVIHSGIENSKIAGFVLNHILFVIMEWI